MWVLPHLLSAGDSYWRLLNRHVSVSVSCVHVYKRACTGLQDMVANWPSLSFDIWV